MTDMKISDGAVEAAAKATCCFGQDCYEEQEGRKCQAPRNEMKLRAEAAGEALFTYYAAHPEELPQEVVDAVRGMDRDKPSETHWM